MVKEVLLVGFGAVGAMYAMILKRSGMTRVTAVARSNYAAVDSNGMHFKSRKYGKINGWRPDRLCGSISQAADRPYSYVVVTTKAIPELTPTHTLLAPLLTVPYIDTHPQPTYVLIQNGLNVETDLYAALKRVAPDTAPQIISTALYIGANLLEENVVEHNDFDRISLGMFRPNDYTTEQNTVSEEAVLSDFRDILAAGGSTVRIVPEIQRVKFSKNFWNVVFSSFTTLTRYTVPAMFRAPPPESGPDYSPYVSPVTAELVDQHVIPALRATLCEVLDVGRALGFPDTADGLPSSQVEDTIANTRAIHVRADSTHCPSMLLDARRERPIEVEVIIGEVVRMARERGVDVPRLEMLYALLLIVQNQILRKLESK